MALGIEFGIKDLEFWNILFLRTLYLPLNIIPLNLFVQR
jgi:hypothetical protein